VWRSMGDDGGRLLVSGQRVRSGKAVQRKECSGRHKESALKKARIEGGKGLTEEGRPKGNRIKAPAMHGRGHGVR